MAVADVDALVKDGSAIDAHARHNTTSVYTAAEIFPMLPEKLSTDLTSLNSDEERLAVVVEMVVGADGSVAELGHLPGARPQSRQARLQQRGGLAGRERRRIPEAIAAVAGLAENLRLQDRVAQRLKNLRHVHGALSLETIEARPVFDGDQIRGLDVEQKNRATEIIEDFMIAANGVTARYLAAKHVPVHPPRRAHAEALGPDRRARPGARRHAAGDARIPWRSMRFSSRSRRPTRCASPISPWRSSSCWARANTWRNGPARRPPGTSVSRSRTTPTPPPRIAATPI